MRNLIKEEKFGGTCPEMKEEIVSCIGIFHICPTDCDWKDWSMWSSCPYCRVDGRIYNQSRNRSYATVRSQFGKKCDGNHEETRSCEWKKLRICNTLKNVSEEEETFYFIVGFIAGFLALIIILTVLALLSYTRCKKKKPQVVSVKGKHQNKSLRYLLNSEKKFSNIGQSTSVSGIGQKTKIKQKTDASRKTVNEQKTTTRRVKQSKKNKSEYEKLKMSSKQKKGGYGTSRERTQGNKDVRVSKLEKTETRGRIATQQQKKNHKDIREFISDSKVRSTKKSRLPKSYMKIAKPKK